MFNSLARIIIHTAKKPLACKTSDGRTVAAICMCGLSRKYPFCDGSHIKTAGEEGDKLYVYDRDGNLLGVVDEIRVDSRTLDISRARRV